MRSAVIHVAATRPWCPVWAACRVLVSVKVQTDESRRTVMAVATSRRGGAAHARAHRQRAVDGGVESGEVARPRFLQLEEDALDVIGPARGGVGLDVADGKDLRRSGNAVETSSTLPSWRGAAAMLMYLSTATDMTRPLL
jgi:hypothetical protein